MKPSRFSILAVGLVISAMPTSAQVTGTNWATETDLLNLAGPSVEDVMIDKNTIDSLGIEAPGYYTFLGTNGDVNDISLEAVPEPSTLAMIVGGVALLLGIQRFRRRA